MKRKDFYIGLWILLLSLTVLAFSISNWGFFSDFILHRESGIIFFVSLIMLVITLFWKEK